MTPPAVVTGVAAGQAGEARQAGGDLVVEAEGGGGERDRQGVGHLVLARDGQVGGAEERPAVEADAVAGVVVGVGSTGERVGEGAPVAAASRRTGSSAL